MIFAPKIPFGTFAGACINEGGKAGVRGCAATPPSRFALGRLQAPANNQTDTTKNRANRLKARRRLKYGDTRRLSVFAVFFYAAALSAFYTARFLFTTVLFAPSFCADRDIPLFSSLYSVKQKQVMLPFITRDYLRELYYLSM